MIALLVSTMAWGQCPVQRMMGDDCQCYCDGAVFVPVPPDQDEVGLFYIVHPPPGTMVPTNVQFRTGMMQSRHWLLNGEPMQVASDGPDRVDDGSSPPGVLQGINFTRPDVLLNPGDQVELWTYDANVHTDELRRFVATWTVGDGPDHMPPVWAGKYDVRTVDTDENECGWPAHSHFVTFEGATDDWSDGALFVHAVDTSEYQVDQLGDERGFDVRWDGCAVDDLNLVERFFPEYQVTLADAAGNTSGPFLVRTGRRGGGDGCGCRGPTEADRDKILPPPYDVVDKPNGGCSTVPAIAPWAVIPLALIRRRTLTSPTACEIGRRWWRGASRA